MNPPRWQLLPGQGQPSILGSASCIAIQHPITYIRALLRHISSFAYDRFHSRFWFGSRIAFSVSSGPPEHQHGSFRSCQKARGYPAWSAGGSRDSGVVHGAVPKPCRSRFAPWEVGYGDERDPRVPGGFERNRASDCFPDADGASDRSQARTTAFASPDSWVNGSVQGWLERSSRGSGGRLRTRSARASSGCYSDDRWRGRFGGCSGGRLGAPLRLRLMRCSTPWLVAES